MKKLVFPILCLAALLLFPDAAISGAQSGVDVCLNIIIPSLLPFMVVIRCMPIGGNVWFAFVMGLIAGYPTGAKILGKNASSGLVCACNNCGPMFIVGAVGVGVFGSSSAGWLIYVAHAVSAVVMLALANRDVCPAPKMSSTGAVIDSAKTMAIVCTYIIIFSAFINIFKFPPIIAGLFEMSRGVAMLSKTMFSLPIAAFFVTFGGACIHMQTFAVVENIKKTSYIVLKAIQGLIAVGATFLLVRVFPLCVPVTSSGTENVSPFVSGAANVSPLVSGATNVSPFYSVWSNVPLPNLWLYSLALAAICVSATLLLTKCFEMI